MVLVKWNVFFLSWIVDFLQTRDDSLKSHRGVLIERKFVSFKKFLIVFFLILDENKADLIEF